MSVAWLMRGVASGPGWGYEGADVDAQVAVDEGAAVEGMVEAADFVLQLPDGLGGFRLHQGGSERFDFCGATFDRSTDRDMIHTNRRPIPQQPATFGPGLGQDFGPSAGGDGGVR